MKKIFFMALAALFIAVIPARAFNPLEAVKGVVNNVTASDKFEVSSLQGTWNYSAPAISFKSDNALNKAGGVAASAAVESKIAPYYKTLGLETAEMTFDAEGNFTLKLKMITLTGTVTKDGDDGKLTFNFKASGKFNLGKVAAFATKSALGELTLTFDASRVISVVSKVASVAGNSTLKTLSGVLNSYDGIYAGARFTKSK